MYLLVIASLHHLISIVILSIFVRNWGHDLLAYRARVFSKRKAGRTSVIVTKSRIFVVSALLAAMSFSTTAGAQDAAQSSSSTQAEVRQKVLDVYNRIRKTRRIDPDIAPEFALNSNGSLLQYAPREQGIVQRFETFDLAPSNIHVTTLLEGKAAVAMFYAQGDVQFAGAPMIRGYRVRVTQTYVKGDDGWVVKSAHYSPMTGGEGIATVPEESGRVGDGKAPPIIHSARNDLPESEMSDDLKKRIKTVFSYWRSQHRTLAGVNGLHIFNSNGGMLVEMSPVQTTEFEVADLQPRDIHIVPLVAGEAAVAIYYVEGSLQVEGGPLVSNYRTRVSQTFVKEFGNWHCKTEHWSKLAGAEGLQTAKVADQIKGEPADKSAYSTDCAEIDAAKHAVRMYVRGNIDAWRSCYTDSAMWTHNEWRINNPIDELADVHRQFHEMIEDVAVTAANFECVTTKDGVKFVHAWLQFRAKYKTGEVVDNTCFLGLRVAEHNRFASEVCIYDTASLPKGSPYSEGEEGK
jgi:hypothetical protein